jgi:hypothetical protein
MVSEILEDPIIPPFVGIGQGRPGDGPAKTDVIQLVVLGV